MTLYQLQRLLSV